MVQRCPDYQVVHVINVAAILQFVKMIYFVPHSSADLLCFRCERRVARPHQSLVGWAELLSQDWVAIDRFPEFLTEVVKVAELHSR